MYSSKSHCGASKPTMKIRDKTVLVRIGDNNKGMASINFFLMILIRALC